MFAKILPMLVLFSRIMSRIGEEETQDRNQWQRLIQNGDPI